jgi:hypothetical protein
MTSPKEELFAATLCKQIAYLEGLLAELGNDPVQDKQIFLKTREVEAVLRELRHQLQPGPI